MGLYDKHDPFNGVTIDVGDIERKVKAVDTAVASRPEPIATRSTIGEMGAGFKRGLFVAVPEMAGGAIKAIADVDSDWYKKGQDLQESARAIAGLPEFQKSKTAEDGAVNKVLVAGAEGVGQMAPVIAGSIINPYLGAGMAAGMYGGNTYQDTKERMLKQEGLDDRFAADNPNDPRVQKAKATGAITGGIQGLGEAGMTLVGGKFIKAALPTLGKSTVQSVLGKTAEPGLAALKQYAKGLGLELAGETITEPLQDEGQAAVERAAGLKDAPKFMEQAAQSAQGGFGTALLLAPFGIPAHVASYSKQRSVQQALVDPAADPKARAAAAHLVAGDLAKIDPAAADNFLQHATMAIGDQTTTGSAPYALDLTDESLLQPFVAPNPSVTVADTAQQVSATPGQQADTTTGAAGASPAPGGAVDMGDIPAFGGPTVAREGNQYQQFAEQPFAAAPAQPAIAGAGVEGMLNSLQPVDAQGNKNSLASAVLAGGKNQYQQFAEQPFANAPLQPAIAGPAVEGMLDSLQPATPSERFQALQWANQQMQSPTLSKFERQNLTSMVKSSDATKQDLVKYWRSSTNQSKQPAAIAGLPPQQGAAQANDLQPGEATQVTAAPTTKTVSPAPKRDRSVKPTQDDLITAIGKLGGINRDQAITQWGNAIKDSVADLNRHASREGKSGILHVVSSKGKDLDSMREALEEHGYLPTGSSIEDMYAKIDQHLTSGKPTYSNQREGVDYDALMAEEENRRLQEMVDMGEIPFSIRALGDGSQYQEDHLKVIGQAFMGPDTKYTTWLKQMKQKLGNLFDSVKKLMMKTFHALKQAYQEKAPAFISDQKGNIQLSLFGLPDAAKKEAFELRGQRWTQSDNKPMQQGLFDEQKQEQADKVSTPVLNEENKTKTEKTDSVSETTPTLTLAEDQKTGDTSAPQFKGAKEYPGKPESLQVGDEVRVDASQMQQVADHFGDGTIHRLTERDRYLDGTDQGNPEYGHKFSYQKEAVKGVTSFAINADDDIISIKDEATAGSGILYAIRPENIGGMFVVVRKSDNSLFVYSNSSVDTNKATVVSHGLALKAKAEEIAKEKEGIIHELQSESSDDQVAADLADLGVEVTFGKTQSTEDSQSQVDKTQPTQVNGGLAQKAETTATTTPEKTPASPTPATSGSSSSSAKTSSVKPGTVTDAGEELKYNKRNRVKGIKWADVQDANDAMKAKQVQKNNVYPKPDYQVMVDDGMQPLVAHLIKQVYDAIPVAPVTRSTPTDADFKLYITAVNRVMDGALAWASNPAAVAAWAQKQSRFAGAMGGQQVALSDLQNATNLYDTVYPGGWKAFADEVRVLGSNSLLSRLQPGYDEARRAIKEIDKGWPGKVEAWQRQGMSIGSKTDVSIREQKQPGGEMLYVVDYGKREYLKTLDTRADAEAFLASLGDHLLLNKYKRLISSHATRAEAVAAAKTKATKEKETGPAERGMNVADAERIGPQRRMPGQDVSSQELMDTFGFRGVNFGNWVPQDERQLHLNHLYDSFFDLAELLGVPPKAVALNGMLGIAVGAQGGGKASAHFVPGLNEINVTRTAGAGALAHEWGHAVDHYFGNLAGFGAGMAPYLSFNLKNGTTGTVRPEILQAFKSIVTAMNDINETPEQVVERIERHDKIVAAGLQKYLARMDKNFQAAAEEVQQAARELLDKLRNEQFGEGRVAISRKSAVFPVIADLYQLSRKHKLKLSVDDFVWLHAAALSVDRAKNADQIISRHQPQRTSTNYLNGANSLDAKRQKPYWSTPEELFARAFDAYLTNRLQTQERKNSYLSGLNDDISTSPKDAELAAISKAFDALLGELKTEETDKGVALYSATEESGNLFTSGLESDTITDKPVAQIKGINPVSAKILRNEGLTPVEVQGETSDMLRSVADRFGLRVIFYRSKTGKYATGTEEFSGTQQAGNLPPGQRANSADGLVHGSDKKTIFLNINSGRHLQFIIGHEISHALKLNNEKAYQQLLVDISPHLDKEKLITYEEYLKTNPLYTSLDTFGTYKEVVADALGQLFVSQNVWSKLAEEKPSLFSKLADAVIKVLDKIKTLFTNEVAPSTFFTDYAQVNRILMNAIKEYAENNGSMDGLTDEIKAYYAAAPAPFPQLDKAKQEELKAEAKRQYDEVVAKYKDTDQWMKAPNGKLTKLSEKQWVSVRTPAFKEWFGDWEAAHNGKDGNGVWATELDVSKVVHLETGEPMVVYHGTKSGGFAAFDPTEADKHRSPMIFAASDRDIAKTYSGIGDEINFDQYNAYLQDEAFEEGEAFDYEKERGVYSVFLNIRNPYETSFEGANWDGTRYDKYIVQDEDGETQYKEDGTTFFDRDDAEDFAEELGEGFEAVEAPEHYETTNSAAEEAKRMGNDGTIIRDVVDEGAEGVGYGDASDVFVFFDGKQAKSAAHNIGLFLENQEELQFSLTSPTTTGLNAADLQKEFSGLPFASKIKVVQTTDQLPGIGRQSLGLNIEGQYKDGTIYLVAGNLPSVERARIVALGHELTHAGQSVKVTDMAVNWFRDAMAKGENGSKFQQATMQILKIEAAKRGYNINKEADFRKAVQEATAVIAETAYRTGDKAGLMTRLLMYLKHFMRTKLGWKTLPFTDKELVATVSMMMRQGEKNLTNGKGPDGGQYAAAWHGSPHDYDKFDSSKIGTGEGAQAYGYGLYFAGNREVAEYYRNALAGGKDIAVHGKPLKYQTDSFANAIRNLLRNTKKGISFEAAKAEEVRSLRSMKVPSEMKAADELEQLSDADISEVGGGRLYKVELAPAEDEYLLWDKPLSEQSEKVKAAINKIGVFAEVNEKITNFIEQVHKISSDAANLVNKMIYGQENERTNSDIADKNWDDLYELLPPDKQHSIDLDLNDIHDYAEMLTEQGRSGDQMYSDLAKEIGSDKAASEYLHSLGIRGIKYLDGNSRSGEKDDYNYVIFNDADVTIEDKYSLASSVSATLSDVDWKAAAGSVQENWKQIANPLDWSRTSRWFDDWTPESIKAAFGYMLAVPHFQAERDATKRPFVDASENREIDRMDMMLQFLGFNRGQEDTRSLKEKTWDFFTKWQSGQHQTDWEKMNQRRADLPADQQKALDALFVEGDVSSASYSSLEKALTNPRIARTKPSAETFALYRDIRDHMDGHVSKIREQRMERMMREAGISEEVISKHIADYRNELRQVGGWMTRNHGEGEHAAAVYHVVKDLKFEIREVKDDKQQAYLPYFPGNAVHTRLVDLAKQAGHKIKVTPRGAIIVTGDQVQGFVDEASKIIPEIGPQKVMVFSRYHQTKGAARNHAELVNKDLKAAMPHNYRPGEQYEVITRQVDTLNESMYQNMRSDMAVEALLEQSAQRALKRGDMSKEQYNEFKKDLVQNTAEVLMGRAAGRYQIRRADYLIEGYDTENAVSLYQDYMMGVSGMMSKADYAAKQFENFRTAKIPVKQWAAPYIFDSLRNQGLGDRISGNLRAFASLWYMGLKPASALINSTQNYTLGWAELSRHIKKGSALALIGKANADIIKGKLTQDEEQLFESAIYRQQEMGSALAEITGHNEAATSKAGKLLHNMTSKALALFQNVEIMNRKTMILAGYRAFKSKDTPKGMIDQEAFEKAMQINSSVNFNMHRGNLPGWARNPVGHTLYALQSFTFNSFNWIFNRMTSGEKRDVMALLRYAGAIVALGGVSALAGGDELDKLYRKLFGKSPKLEFQEFTRKNLKQFGSFGELVDTFAWHGAAGASGVNISNSLRLQIPVVSQLLSGEGMSESAAGVFGGLLKKGSTAIRAAAKGDAYRAVEAAAPEAVSGAMRAYRQYDRGVTTLGGKQVYDENGQPLKYSAADATLRLAGLQPMQQSKRTEVSQIGREIAAEWRENRQNVIDAIRLADTPAERQKTLKLVQNFNVDLRGSQAAGLVQPITMESIRNAVSQRKSKADKNKAGWLQNRLQ